jgi:hypothetical protein
MAARHPALPFRVAGGRARLVAVNLARRSAPQSRSQRIRIEKVPRRAALSAAPSQWLRGLPPYRFALLTAAPGSSLSL